MNVKYPQKAPGKHFLEIEFREPLLNALLINLKSLGEGKIVMIRGIEYRVDAYDYEKGNLLERDNRFDGDTFDESEWRPVATLNELACFVIDMVGSTPSWLRPYR